MQGQCPNFCTMIPILAQLLMPLLLKEKWLSWKLYYSQSHSLPFPLFFSLPTCDQEPIPQSPSLLYHSAPGHIISHHYDFVVTDIRIYFHVGQLGIGWCGIHEAGFKLLIPPGWARSTEHLRSGQQLGWGGSGVGGGERISSHVAKVWAKELHSASTWRLRSLHIHEILSGQSKSHDKMQVEEQGKTIYSALTQSKLRGHVLYHWRLRKGMAGRDYFQLMSYSDTPHQPMKWNEATKIKEIKSGCGEGSLGLCYGHTWSFRGSLTHALPNISQSLQRTMQKLTWWVRSKSWCPLFSGESISTLINGVKRNTQFMRKPRELPLPGTVLHEQGPVCEPKEVMAHPS